MADDKKLRDATYLDGIAVRPVYGPADLGGFDPARDLGEPGQYPFTRGIHPHMYRARVWTMRQYIGFGTPRETNARFKYLMAHGQDALNVAFDLPTQLGLDSDDPRAEGEVGRPRFAADGRLLRPEGVDRWVLVGASLGQGYTDATEEGPGMFHRVYLEPSAYQRFLDSGGFPDGTMLALTIRRPERRVPPSRSGWTEGDLVALEMAVKDSSRFQGGWAYFDFGRDRDTAAAIPRGTTRSSRLGCRSTTATDMPRLVAVDTTSRPIKPPPTTTSRPPAFSSDERLWQSPSVRR